MAIAWRVLAGRCDRRLQHGEFLINSVVPKRCGVLCSLDRCPCHPCVQWSAMLEIKRFSTEASVALLGRLFSGMCGGAPPQYNVPNKNLQKASATTSRFGLTCSGLQRCKPFPKFLPVIL